MPIRFEQTISCIFVTLLLRAQAPFAKPIKGAWKELPDIIEGPSQYHGSAEINGSIYLVGGVGAFRETLHYLRVYDVDGRIWRVKSAVPRAIHRPNVAAVRGKLYVLGGLLPSFDATGQSWVYDPVKDEWEEIEEMGKEQARGAAAVGVIGKNIYVAGGFRNFQAVGLMSCYDTKTGKWTHDLAKMKHPRDHALGVSMDQSLYVIGGRNGSIESTSNHVEQYFPSEDKWLILKKTLLSRSGMAGVVIDGRIMILGGEGVVGRSLQTGVDHQVIPVIEEFNATANKWKIKGSMKEPRHGLSAINHKNELFIAGGANVTLFGPVRVLQSYIPPT
ncbi:hypothetical protein BSKO_07898 [Bryopsis sp. KO-2023]|nr:hypothetical protein BSKO_07898 [Bryopsis sp. KO-2023]